MLLQLFLALAAANLITVNPDITTFSFTQTTGNFRAVRSTGMESLQPWFSLFVPLRRFPRWRPSFFVFFGFFLFFFPSSSSLIIR